ncbi:DNA (cytosine-5-)-methyltransferase [Nocardioides panacis]|uniref:DNA (cytosine-5-)-methyltransferase n=1 Tax=Nocardioides panacis TaxID=2849501 RepID=A0A975Y179_9ACTN|nr:DNA (cytosine-5-)-methyltransferase [Nocardioides panacis]QWZ09232.1 DNA (cytosine-5-)-methyltransferase [Nocardioides panacis]
MVGLFAGIGGLELGLSQAGHHTELLCEFWGPAASTLRRRFAGVDVVGDIRDIDSLPGVEIVTAGFPCTDLSQVGRTRGIDGAESGLVREVFRLIEQTPPRWVVLENVPNMLTLAGGNAIRFITEWFDDHGWHWAYRTVDSQNFGVAQRRRRVILVASKSDDPRTVLFADEAGTAQRSPGGTSTYGFYWTEGNRGLGWAEGMVPTLKGGSNIGIPSPPAVWVPSAEPGTRVVRPSIRSGERLQGFPAGWTDHVLKTGHRWKLVGNAVSVPVARWVGDRLSKPGEPVEVGRRPLASFEKWPGAAASVHGCRDGWALSERPLSVRRSSLSRVLEVHGVEPLSRNATKGFADRLSRSRLRAGGKPFHDALSEHVSAMS